MTSQILTLDVCDGADVVFGGEHELVVEHPVGLVVEAGGRVQLDHLVVLAGQVVAGPLQMRPPGRHVHGQRVDTSVESVELVE